MEEKFRFRVEDEKMDAFAKGEHYGNDFYYAGFFYAYQGGYMENIARYFFKLIEEDKGARQALEDFLSEDKPIEGEVYYSPKEVTGWLKPWNIFKNTQSASFPRLKPNSKFNIYELKVGSSSEVDQRSGLIFLTVEGYEDSVLDRRLEWDIRKLLMEEWKSLSDNQEVKDYLEEVLEVYKILEYTLPDKYEQGLSRRIAYYLFPIELDTFGGKVIVSKASLYKRREETRQNLWDDFSAELEGGYKEDLEHVLKERGKELNYLKSLLDKALSDEHLKLLREDWKRFLRKCLKGEGHRLRGVFVGKVPEKNPPWVNFGIYIIPSVELKLMVFAEEGFKINNTPAQGVAKILKGEFERFRFLGDAKIILEDDKVYPLEKLFGNKNFFIKLIKGLNIENNKLKSTDSLDLIFALSYFTSRILNLVREIKEGKYKKEFRGILLLLNTELEETERYLLWNFVNFIYDYFGIPIQTVTKRSLREIRKGKDSNAVIKNLVISLYKDSKILEIGFDGFYLPRELVVYAIVEKPSTRFFYRRNELNGGARHCLYEVYKITIKGEKAQIGLENKFFELHGMKDIGIERWIEEVKKIRDVRFCFITPLKESKLGEIYEKLSNETDKFLLIRYDELKTAYFSEKTEKDCFIVYTQEMRRLMDSLGIQMDKDVAVIALKPAHAKSIEDEMYHPSLQLFFTEKVGWERDEVYSERKNLFIFTVLALSMYESESFTTPFSKLSIWSKERNYYLTIRRSNNEYTFPLKPVLYEMLYFIQERPGKK